MFFRLFVERVFVFLCRSSRAEIMFYYADQYSQYDVLVGVVGVGYSTGTGTHKVRVSYSVVP
jgi:hypothetical protein